MKILLYFEGIKKLKKSGIGRALTHQEKAFDLAGLEYTTNLKDSFDLVHINTLFSKSKRILKKCKKNHVPVVVHGHSTYEDFRNSFRIWKLVSLWFYPHIKYMYKHADLVITPTPYSKGLIEGHDLGTKVVALSNGIDLKAYDRDESKIGEFKKCFSITNEPVVIGIGFPFERKGILDFFEVAKKLPDVKFIWFGGLNPILLPHKINKAIRHKPDNVIMPGYIDNSIIKGALQYAKCLLFPSYEETEGIAVLEALASKCPVVVRNIGVYDGWLSKDKNAFMANSNEEFVSQIKYILENDVSAISEEGYKTAKERDLSAIGNKFKEIFLDFYNQFNNKK